MDSSSIINDPNFVPLANHAGQVLVKEDGETVLIVSSTLPVRYASTAFGKARTWLRTPPRHVRGRR